ncbi:MAG: restriction endonuclease subunit S [Acidobacteriota bacterium]
MSLPETWVERTLREVCEPTKLWNPQRDVRDEFWYIDVSAVSRESYAIREPQRIKGTEAPSRARKIVQSEDAIFATVRPTLRRVAFVGPDFDNQIASTAFCVVRANREKASPRFLYYLLLTDFLNDEIAKFESGASYPAVNDKDVLDRTVPLPPKPDQEKIAAVLWKVQRAIEIEDKLIATARELKQSAMRQLFTHGLRGEPQKETKIGLLPESWNPKLLQNCCDVVSSSLSYTDFESMSEATDGNAVLAMGIKVSDMNLSGNESYIMRANLQKRVDFSLAEKKLVPANTIVFPKRGAAIATNKKRMTTAWTVLDPNLIGVCAGEGVNSSFLFYWFQNFDLRTITEPGPTPQLNKKNLTPLLLPIPDDPDEQAEIAAILQTIDRKISVHERKRATLQELFKTLLHQLMTGQICVHDLDIDTSEVTGC